MTWVEITDDHPFPLESLPYGVFTRGDDDPRIGVAVGDYVLDLAPVLDDDVFARPSLNSFLARGRAAWRETRTRVTDLLVDASHRARVQPHLVDRRSVTLHLPVEIGDYVDFYSSLEHAENLGRILRPGGEPVAANWRHLPVGYHGRAGTIVVSGTPIVRPSGQRVVDGAPRYGPSLRLDIEAEVGFVVGVPSRLGTAITTEHFADHVFGVVLVNDWSARDIQAWEYQPLGPFLGKSFATSISPWVVPLDALEPARIEGRAQNPPPLPYLQRTAPWGLDLRLEVALNDTVIARPPFAGMYWTPDQQLAHLTVNGASVRTGDLFASGTVSGEYDHERGSLIELTWNGRDELVLDDGSRRTFLQDGDRVAIRGTAALGDDRSLGLGEVSGTICGAAYR
jgi:fumarylacetoacetase